MDIPKPPDDLELKNIIDKLANFVARNGPEFEQMTKQKQKDNPKFSFLFAGEHFNYYQYRVTTEQAILKQQQQKMAHQQAMIQQTITQQSLRTAPWQQSAVTPGSGPGLLPPAQSALQEQIEQQRQAAIEQIKQSETNLAAQYQSIMQQQQVMIDDAITKAKKEQLMALSSECEMSLEEMDEIVQPIIESCTKDAISNGKNWIFTRNTSQRHGDLIAHYLLDRITAKEAPFEQRLHLIYLVNDILHHCLRRNAEELRKSIESVVVPLFCIAQLAADEDRQTKLTKLLSLWENNKYFEQNTIDAMKNPLSAVANYQASLAASHATIVTNISQEMNTRYLALQKQHQEYAAHLNGQIAALEHQLLMQNTAPQLPPGALPAPSVPGANSSMGGQSIPPLMSAGGPNTGPFPPQSFGGPSGFGPPPPQPPGIFGALQPAQQFDYSHGQGPVVMTEFGGMPPQSGPPVNIPPLPLPDLSKPPPGFPPPGFQQMGLPPPPPLMSLNIRPPHEVDLMPSMPYYDLPAGLMAPLVKLEDSDYKPLNPKDIRLPPPMPPTDRLLAAVELFYSPPSHERPRDSDGWEKLGLYEFFKAKQKARKLKDEKSRQRSRSRSRSPRRDRDGGRHRSRSRSPSSRRDRRRSRSRSRSSSRSRSKSRSRSRERSKTPPGFYAEPFYQKTIDTRLGQENKGHQLLTKMGWGGGGLGQLEQGMTDPVAHADVRDRQDMYKGIGISLNDPFENFRKNRSQGYVTRMREKAETASATTGGTSLSQDSGERD